MKKRIYRRIPVNDFQPETVSHADLGGKLVFAIDVAKVDMVAAVAAADGRVLHTICWKAPDQNPAVLAILRGFRAQGVAVEAVMEPSGTYGDVLRHQLERDAFPVFMVSGKRTHDAKEIFDGVPSLHDAKAAAIIARLHADGLSTRLLDEGPDRRQLRAALAIMDLYQERYLQLVHRLESWLARHWPELPTLIELTSSSLMALLARIGGPADVAAAPDKAQKLLLGISHRLLPDEKVAAILASAKTSVGVPLVGLERDALMAIAEGRLSRPSRFHERQDPGRLSRCDHARRRACACRRPHHRRRCVRRSRRRQVLLLHARFPQSHGPQPQGEEQRHHPGPAQDHQTRPFPRPPVPVAGGLSLDPD